MTTKIGTISQNGNVLLNWFNADTDERGVGYFNLNNLCELGYGDVRMVDIVVMVALERLER